MGIQERKARERAALRQKIVDSATRLFLEKGYAGTSIRQIATDIEYSPATIYLYFRDKSELFRAIIDNAFGLMNDYFAKARIISDPLSRLRELCRQYLIFARQYPAYYDLILISEAWKPKDAPQEDDFAQQINAIFSEVIQDCRRSNYFLGKDPEQMALSVWAFVHGLACLEVKNRLHHSGLGDAATRNESTLNEFFNLLMKT